MEPPKNDWCSIVWAKTFLTMDRRQYLALCGRRDIGKIATAADHCLAVSGAGKDKLQGFVPLVSLDSISGAA